MNATVPRREWHGHDGRLKIVWLDPARYSATERLYIAARVTRSYLDPDQILARADAHLNGWHLAQYGETLTWGGLTTEQRMHVFLREVIHDRYHDSVLEFAGMEYTLWVCGLSLGTLRDVDRHRRFSYEQLTTRHPAFYLKGHKERLQKIIASWDDVASLNVGQLDLTHGTRQFLTDLFYVHPKRETTRGIASLDRYLIDSARSLLGYLIDCEEESAHGWDGDDARGRLTLSLRTPFLMAGNQRDLFEAGGKRTCYRVGMHEYVTLFRGITELLHGPAPFLAHGVGRWCPAGLKDGEGCCRVQWCARLTDPISSKGRALPG